MNKKTLRLIEKGTNYTPLEGRILIVPNKIRTHKDKGFESRPVDPDSDPMDPDREMIMQEVITDVNNNFQTGIVIQKPEDETRFNVGDTIVFQLRALQEFDLIKGVSMIRKYDVEFIEKPGF